MSLFAKRAAPRTTLARPPPAATDLTELGTKALALLWSPLNTITTPYTILEGAFLSAEIAYIAASFEEKEESST